METSRQKNKTYHQENPWRLKNNPIPTTVSSSHLRTNSDYGMLLTFKKR